MPLLTCSPPLLHIFKLSTSFPCISSRCFKLFCCFLQFRLYTVKPARSTHKKFRNTGHPLALAAQPGETQPDRESKSGKQKFHPVLVHCSHVRWCHSRQPRLYVRNCACILCHHCLHFCSICHLSTTTGKIETKKGTIGSTKLAKPPTKHCPVRQSTFAPTV